jgi:RNA polymerase primary sigma factor
MYLREMGSVELLSREGEIAIAKRIEAGREKMIGAICESPLTMEAVIDWRDQLLEERVLLRDIIDLDSTYGGTTESATASQDEEGDGDDDESAEDAEGEDDDEDDDDENKLSFAAMEAALKPQVLETFAEIAKTYKKLHRLQEIRHQAALKKDTFTRAQERRYEKLKGRHGHVRAIK